MIRTSRLPRRCSRFRWPVLATDREVFLTANRVLFFAVLLPLWHGCGDTPSTTSRPTCVPVHICDLSTATQDATDASDSSLATDDWVAADTGLDRVQASDGRGRDSDVDSGGEPDQEAPEETDVEPTPDETQTEPDQSQLDESEDQVQDMPTTGCVDAFERHTTEEGLAEDNDRWSRSTLAHAGLLIGQLGDCTGVGWQSCEAGCDATDRACSELSLGVCGCCECEQTPELSLCSADDYDNLSFRALAGDEVHIRIEPLWAHPPRGYRESIMALVWQPGADTDADAILPDVDQGIRARWTEGGRFLEAEIGSAKDSDGGVLTEYVVTILNQDPEIDEIPYRFDVQVLPVSRGCPADEWDPAWDVYDELADSRCETGAACNFVTEVEGQICPWDTGDSLRFSVDASGRHRVRIAHLADAPLLSARLLDDEGNERLSLCASLDDVCRTTTYFEEVVFLEAGQWGIRVEGLGDFSPNRYTASVSPAD